MEPGTKKRKEKKRKDEMTPSVDDILG